jgi:hypothetical protein
MTSTHIYRICLVLHVLSLVVAHENLRRRFALPPQCDNGDIHIGDGMCSHHRPARVMQDESNPDCYLGGYLRSPNVCSIDITSSKFATGTGHTCPAGYDAAESRTLCRRNYKPKCTSIKLAFYSSGCTMPWRCPHSSACTRFAIVLMVVCNK